MTAALDALERLREGNRRFVSGEPGPVRPDLQARRAELVAGQHPFAVVVGCSDSRVPAEMVFGQGLGDLFTIRVAGNVLSAPEMGSVEFAAGVLGTRLVVVMGHSRCGAVQATLDELQRPGGSQPRNLRSILDLIRPSVAGLLDTALRDDPEKLMQQAVRANVRAGVQQLRRGSPLLEQLGEAEGLRVVGAEYSLATGVVDFFEGVPGRTP